MIDFIAARDGVTKGKPRTRASRRKNRRTLPSRGETARLRLTRPRRNLGTKCPKANRLPGKELPPRRWALAATDQPPAPRDAARGVKEEIVYLNLAELHPFKNHPYGVRDDVEMQWLVESVKSAGVNQPALVRPRKDGRYEIIAEHRHQHASELARFVNMPCIVRNMTDNNAIKQQEIWPGEDDRDAGEIVILPEERYSVWNSRNIKNQRKSR